MKKQAWKLLCWKVNKAPVIDVFAANDLGLTALDLAYQLGDGFEDVPNHPGMRHAWEEEGEGIKRRILIRGTLY